MQKEENAGERGGSTTSANMSHLVQNLTLKSIIELNVKPKIIKLLE
jgi:hypothetical protein